MAAPPVSHPLQFLAVQMKGDLDAAAVMCLEIKRGEPARSTKQLLEELYAALAAGPGFISDQFRNVEGVGSEGVDADGGDGKRMCLFCLGSAWIS